MLDAPEIFNPLDPDHYRDPAEHLRAARTTRPVSRPRDGLCVVASDAEVRAVLGGEYSSRGNFRLEPGDLDMPHLPVTNLDPPEHTVLRKRLLKSFAPVKLRRLQANVDQIVAAAVKALPDGGIVDLYQAYVRRVPAAVLYSFLGIPENLWEEAQALGDVVVSRVPEPTDALPEFHALLKLISGLVVDRRAHPDRRHDDVLDNLCFADVGETELSDFEVVVHTFQLLVAATDTTRSLIANCLYRLLVQRDLWERVLVDRSLLPPAIEESLRLDTPAAFMIRTAVQDGQILDCPVQTGDKVYVSLESANRDEQRWGEEADQFILPRPDVLEHVAFGRGRHTCIGAPLARMEATTAVQALLDRFPTMVLREPYRAPAGISSISRRSSEVWVDLAPRS